MKISDDVIPVLSELEFPTADQARIVKQLDRTMYTKVDKALQAIGGQERVDLAITTGEVETAQGRRAIDEIERRPGPITYGVYDRINGLVFTGLASEAEARAKASEKYDRPAHRDDFLEQDMPPEPIVFWHGQLINHDGERVGVESVVFGIKRGAAFGRIEEEHRCAACHGVVNVRPIAAPAPGCES